MKIFCSHTDVIALGDLKPHPKNPNVHPKKQIKLLAKIMREHGVRNPIVISNRSGFMTKGHGRLLAAQLNEWEKFPVDRQDYANEAEELADMVADNKIQELSELDEIKVQEIALDLGKDFDFELFGTDEIDVASFVTNQGLIGDDEIPEVSEEPKTKPGDIYLLGNHRLMCGDSTNIQHVERLMNGEKADITFTSPPYNAAKDSHLNDRVSGFSNKYKNNSDAMTDDDYRDFLCAFTGVALQVSDFVFVNIQLLSRNRLPLLEWQYTMRHQVKDILIWNKTQCPPNIVRGAFNTKWEYVIAFANNADTRGFPCSWQGKYPNVIETESNSGNEFAQEHKAGFPVAFPLWILEKMDFVKSVYEPFAGTGTTAIACEKTNRKCFMSEIDPHYVDVIVQRWMRYSGQMAYLAEDSSGKLKEPVPYAEIDSYRGENTKAEFKSIVQKNAGQSGAATEMRGV